MCIPGQLSHTLFAGLDNDNLKTFSLEVKSCTVLGALNSLERAIAELKLCQFQFGYENKAGVKATVRHS